MIVTVEADATTPRVRIDTSGDAVWRVRDGVSTPVRGRPSGGVVYDYECPQETPVTYTALEPGVGAPSVSAPVEMPDVGVWLVPISSPDLAALIRVQSFDGWSRPGNASVAEVPGRRNPVAVTFARGSRRGSLTAVAVDGEEFAALSACLDAAGPMFLSFPATHWPAFGLMSYVVVGDVSESPLEAIGFDQQTWTVGLPLTPIDRPDLVASAEVTIDSLVGTVDSLTGTIDTLGS